LSFEKNLNTNSSIEVSFISWGICFTGTTQA
jgi:hypothetical protein